MCVFVVEFKSVVLMLTESSYMEYRHSIDCAGADVTMYFVCGCGCTAKCTFVISKGLPGYAGCKALSVCQLLRNACV